MTSRTGAPDDNGSGLDPRILHWWDNRIEQLIAEQRGSDALALTDEFVVTKPKKPPKAS